MPAAAAAAFCLSSASAPKGSVHLYKLVTHKNIHITSRTVTRLLLHGSRMASYGGIDVSALREKARRDLLDLLEGVRGRKNLVIEKALAGSVSLFVKASTLVEYGVDKFFFLENDNVDSSQKNVIFLARGESAEHIIAIVDQIKRLQMNRGVEHDISVILVPRRTLVANKIFEDAGILGDISIEELQLYFLPLDSDLLSLELEDGFKDLYLHKDPTATYLAARALMQIQQQHGLFPRIIGKGDQAQRLMELLLRMRAETLADEPSVGGKLGAMPSSEIESLIVIDREVDFLSVLLTQLTYEGFIDELYGIKDNQAEIETSIVGAGPGPQNQGAAGKAQESSKRKIMLDSSDQLYTELRDANFARVGGMLQKTARRMQSEFGGGNIEARTTAELRDLVRKLPGYQASNHSLGIHIGLTYEIGKHTRSDTFRKDLEIQQNLTQGADPSSQHDAIEDLIAQGAPLETVLRLLCLESSISGGIKQKELENFRTLVMHAYGQQHLLTLDALERIGLLIPRAGGFNLGIPGTVGSAGAAAKTNYSYLRRALKLIVDEVNEVEPNDIAYVYSGYAPLSVRLVQSVVQKARLFATVNKGSTAPMNGVSSAAIGWQGFEDALKAVKGPTFNKIQKGEESATKARTILSGSGGGRKTVVVMFLGGITRTEVAALRFIAQQESGKRILICTTGIITGGKMIDAARENMKFGQNNET